MDIVRKSLAEKRGNTDASLGAERASTDAAAEETTARAQRLAADLIERERLVVDEQLRIFRDRADVVLAGERLASHVPLESVTLERARADRATIGERAINDSILQNERQRSDDAVQMQRSEQAAADRAEGVRRADTDEKLGAERRRVDSAVTFLGRTENALSLAEAQVERRSDVMAIVAHELRNPLAVIAMNTDFVAEGLVDVEAREAIEEVQRSVARMQRILMDLVDLARIEGGTLRIEKRPFDVGVLLNEILTLYGPLFAKRDVTFTSGSGALGLVASFDHDRIVQVLSNLLTNAMKFTSAGGTVGLGVERHADAVELAVSDTGAGMAAHALPNVFTRFWQARREPGTSLGLGLYICEKIITAHGGRIWVESELGRGTTFRFTLPIHP